MDYAGRPTTNGVVAFEDRIARSDNPAIANWRTAGAIGIGRTNVPPFSARFFTSNALHGRTYFVPPDSRRAAARGLSCCATRWPRSEIRRLCSSGRIR